MNKYLYAGFSAVLLTISLLAASSNFELRLFANTDQALAYGRIGLAVFLLLYCLFRPLRQPAVQYMVRGIGTALLIVGIAGLLSPTYWGLMKTYVLPIDLFIALQGGITALLAGLELSTSPKVSARHTAAIGDTRTWIHQETEKLTVISTAPIHFVTKLYSKPRRIRIMAGQQLSKS